MKINKVEDPVMAVRISQYPKAKMPEFLLVGRSNVGKSSFINTLINRRNFARVSGIPGKTQTLNFYLINDNFYLVDVPGYGYAKVSKEVQRKFGLMIEEYLINRENLKHVFMLVDYRHKPTNDDLLMYNFLKYYGLTVTVVATKYDKVLPNDREKQNKLISNTMKLADGDNLVFFSSVNRKGKEEVLNIINANLNS
ncbi:MAG TPA: ribosome biogenesis GTP-binding protein YihA/YsxC [Bacilli bacterium]|nr:ribosome biogenesis GTP-binding protein YihA/YsxC [Bacilli bacterium]